MVKVFLGWMNDNHGAVEASAGSGSLVYDGPDPEHMRCMDCWRYFSWVHGP